MGKSPQSPAASPLDAYFRYEAALDALLLLITFQPVLANLFVAGDEFYSGLPYQANMLLHASFIVLSGSIKAARAHAKHAAAQSKALASGKENTEQHFESLSSADVYKFPFMASASLLTLFFALQYFKDWVNFLLSLYFSVIGVFALFAVIEPYVDKVFDLLPSVLNPAREFKTRIVILDVELADASLKPSGILALIACALAAFMPTYGYFFSQHWLLSNIFGICYALKGLEMLSPGSYKNGFVLLCGLFFYDVFWVFKSSDTFGKNVMVEVAKNLQAPIKLLFPKNFNPADEGKNFSMLGLGDIVIPGIFLALLLRFDAIHKTRTFVSAWFGYVAALVVTVVIMILYNHAQPALLYLVPANLGCSALHGLCVGKFGALWSHVDEPRNKPADGLNATGDNGKKAGKQSGKKKK